MYPRGYDFRILREGVSARGGAAMDPSVTSAQQAAITSVRERYERGEISYETLREGLDRIVAAGSAEECDTILRELPASPAAPLAALDPPVTAVMGEIKLDLGRAALPPRARIHVRAVMADVTLYVPSSIAVSVRSRVYL